MSLINPTIKSLSLFFGGLFIILLMWNSSIFPSSCQLYNTQSNSLVSFVHCGSKFANTSSKDSLQMKNHDSSILSLIMKARRTLEQKDNITAVTSAEESNLPSIMSLNKGSKKQRDNDNTYIPGLLTVEENNLILSSGLTSKVIAQSNRQVNYSNGMKSKTKFHEKPDGAAVFMIQDGPNTGGLVYY